MNKAYKVLWNHARGQSVVTDEHRVSRGKCKSRRALVAAAVAGALAAGLGSYPALATDISAASDWSHTQITQQAGQNIYNIKSAKTLNGTDVNRLSAFTLDQGHIANFNAAGSGTKNILNLVNAQITVNGVVNSVTADKKIGGSLFFVSPKGMTVGASGVINAGSLTAVITTEKQFKEWNSWTGEHVESNELYAGLKEGGSLIANLQSGEVPINPSGVITINGSINTANKITLAASQVNVAKGASIRNTALTTEEIKKVVNVADSGVTLDVTEMAAAEAADGSGDILLLARSEGGSANAKVDVSGKVTARGSVTAKALAGNGTYKFAGSGVNNGYTFDPDNNQFEADIKAVVNIGASGIITAAQDVSMTTLAENIVGATGSGIVRNISGLTLQGLGMTTPANFNAGYGSLTTTAEVTTEAGSVVTAGRDLKTAAEALTTLHLGASTAALKVTDALSTDKTDAIPSVATTIGLTDSKAKVNIEGTLSAGRNLTLTAKDSLDAELKAASSTSNSSQNAHIAFIYADLKGSAAVTVGENAVLELTGANSASSSVVTVSADHTSKIISKAETTIPQAGYAGLAFNYTDHTTSASVDIKNTGTDGSSGIRGKAQQIAVNASNTTTRETVGAENSDGSGYGAKLKETLANAARTFVLNAMGKEVSEVDFGYDAESFKLGGSIAVIKGTQTAAVNLAGNYLAAEALTVNASSVKEDYNYVSTSYVNGKPAVQDQEDQRGETVAVGGLALLIAHPGYGDEGNVASEVNIADGAVLSVSGGDLRITNKALIEYNRPAALVQDIVSDLEKLGTIFTAADPNHKDYPSLVTAWEAVQTAGNNMKAYYSNLSQSEAKLKDFAAGSKEFLTAAANFLKVAAVDGLCNLGTDFVAVVMDTLEFIKVSNYVNSYVASSASGDDNSYTIAGSVGYIGEAVRSSIVIGKGAQLSAYNAQTDGNAGHLMIETESQNQSVAAGGHLGSVMGLPFPDMSGNTKSSVGASFIYQNLSTQNVLRIREGAVLSGDSIGLVALDAADATTVILNADVSKGSFGLGMNVGLVNTYGNNTVEIDDEAEVLSDGTILIEAVRDDSVQTVSVAADIGYGSGAAAMVGGSAAVNIGSLNNTVAVKDNDVLSEGEKSEYSLSGSIGASKDAYGLYNASGSQVVILAQSDLAENAIGVAASVSMSGQTPQASPSTLDKFLAWIDKTNLQATGKVKDLGNWLSGKAYSWSNGIHGQVESAANQNTNLEPITELDDPTPPGDADGQATTNGADSVPEDTAHSGTDTDTELTSSPKDGVNIALSASAAWNDTDINNTVNITADDFTIAGSTVVVDALTDKWVGAWAGSAAISYIKLQNEVGNSAAADGTVAGNSGTYTTSVIYNGGASDKAGITVAGAVTNRALSDGTVVAEGLSLGVGAADWGTNNYVVDANVSASILTNKVGVEATHVTVEGLKSASGTAPSAWSQTAWIGDTQVTGGTSFGLAVGNGNNDKSLSLGLIAAAGDIENTVTSTFDRGSVKDASAFAVKALASVTQVTTAAGVHYAAGDNGYGLAGSIAVSILDNTVKSGVTSSTIVTAGDATAEVSSRVASSSEKKEFSDLISSDPAASYLKAMDPQRKALTKAQAKELGLSTKDLLGNVTLKTEYTTEGTANTQKIYDFIEKGRMVQTTVAASLAFSGGASGAAGILVTKTANDFASGIDSVTLTGDASGTLDFVQAADDSVVSVGVSAGIAGSTEKGNAAGSVVVATVTQKAGITDNKFTVKNATNLTLGADNKATTVNVTGNVGISTGDDGFAVGAAVAVANSNNFATLSLTDSSVAASGDFSAGATNSAAAWTAAVDGAGSQNFTLGGSVVVSRVNNSAKVNGSALTLQNLKSASFAASDKSVLWTLGGAVGISVSNVGVSGAVVYTEAGRGKSAGTVAEVKDVTLAGDIGGLAVTADSESNDHTLVLGVGVGAGGAGISGLASVNEIVHKTSAALDGLKGEKSAGAVTVRATQDARVNSLTINAGASDSAGIGIGVAVNKINNSTSAVLSNVAKGVTMDSLLLRSRTTDTIKTIAVAGAGSGNGALSISVGVNLITDNTDVSLTDSEFTVKNAAVVEAVSDDTVSNYVGTATGAASAAGDLSVNVNEKKGSTKAAVKNAVVTAGTEGRSTLTATKGVDDEAIFDKVAQDVNIGYWLGENRKTEEVKGLAVGATSTETIKNFVMNFGGAGSAAVNGTVSVNYLGGSTETSVTDSALSSKEGVAVYSGDYANIGNVSTSVSGAGEAAVNISVSVHTSDHATKTTVDNSKLNAGYTAGDVFVTAEGKEGISSLTIGGAGSGAAALAPLVSVSRLLSDVSVSVQNQSIAGGANYRQNAYYLGRANALGVGVAGSVYAATAPSVVVNYFGNNVGSSFASSYLGVSQDAEISADKNTDVLTIGVDLQGAFAGVGVYVDTNTIEGAARTDVSGSILEAQGNLTVSAANTDKLRMTGVNISGGAAGVLASVVVNKLYSDAAVNIGSSFLKAQKGLTVKASQDRFINLTEVAATGGVGAIGANVVVTYIGTDDDPYAGLTDDDKKKVTGYINEYGATGLNGAFKTALAQTSGVNLVPDAITDTAKAATAAETQVSSKDTGTSVTVDQSILQGASVLVSAEEDTAKGAEITMTTGTGTAAGAALAATVDKLRIRRNLTVNVLRSAVFDVSDALTGTATVRTLTDGSIDVESTTASVGIITGEANYMDVGISGGALVNMDSTTVRTGSLLASAKDRTFAQVWSMGGHVTGVEGGANVANISDSSSQKVTVANSYKGGQDDLVGSYDSEITAAFTAEAVRAATFSAFSISGGVGVLEGFGALATVKDTGSAEVSVLNSSVTGSSFTALANNRGKLSADSTGAGLKGAGLGVAKATIEVTGQSLLTVSGNTVSTETANLAAAAGIARTTVSKDEDGNEVTVYDDSDALQLDAQVASYGGIIAGADYNVAVITNKTASSATVSDNTFTQYAGKDANGEETPVRTDLTVQAQANAVYTANSTVGNGGVISSGNTEDTITHAASASVVLSGTGSVASLEAGALNRETVTAKADSAGGGVLDVGDTDKHSNTFAVRVDHTDSSSSSVSVSGSWTTEKDAEIYSVSSHDVKLSADNVRGAVAGFSGAQAASSMHGTNTVNIAGSLTAGTGLNAYANTVLSIGSAGGTYAVSSAVYGVLNGTGIRAMTDISRTNEVTVAKDATLTSGGDLLLSAYSSNTTDLRAQARAGGAIEGVEATSDHTVALKNTVSVAENASLATKDSDSELILSASGVDTVSYESMGDVQGSVVGGAGAIIKAKLNRDDSVTVASGANLYGAGDVMLYAGKDVNKKESSFDYTTVNTALAHALFGAPNRSTKNNISVNDSVAVSGSVSAVRNIEGYAQLGSWSQKQSNRFWTAVWADSDTKYASSHSSDTTTDISRSGSIRIDGSLLAGLRTSASVTIGGKVYNEQGVTVEGQQAAPTLIFGGVAGDENVSLAEESESNVYYERYQKLLKIIAEYSGVGTEDATAYTALAAYKAEAEYLLNQMLARKMAVLDSSGNVIVQANDATVSAVKVSGITVSGGNIGFNTGSVTGTGSITANAAKNIDVVNNSTLNLIVEDLHILEKGGNVTLGDQTVSSIPTFSGKLTSEADQSDPTMYIASTFSGSVSVTAKDSGGNTVTQSTPVTTGVRVLGTVENNAGNLTVSAASGDINIYADRLAAGGSLTVSAASGNVSQGYSSGITNIGGDVQEQWADAIEAWKYRVNILDNLSVGGKIQSDVLKGAAEKSGAMVAGGDIFLAGDIININGTVQSGFAEYTLSVDASMKSKIAAIESAWKKKGSPSAIDVYSTDYQITSSGTVLNSDGTYSRTIASWYDPVNKRIVVDDIDPKGGHITITGQLISTGGGSIKAAAGAANVTLDAANYAVQLGTVSTGNIAGVIELTDTSYYGSTWNEKTVSSLVTKWTDDGTGTSVSRYFTIKDSAEKLEYSGASATSYAPRTGLVYFWTDATYTGKVVDRYSSQKFTIWKLIDMGKPTTWDSVKEETVTDQQLTQGESIKILNYELGDGLYATYSKSTVKDESESYSHTRYEYNSCFHMSGRRIVEEKEVTGTTRVWNYELKADNEISIGFIGGGSGSGTVKVTAGGDVVLGSEVSASNGSVVLTSNKGSIFNGDASAKITGASNVTLKASGSVGTEESAIVLSGGDSNIVLNAQAGKNVYIDASSVGQDVAIVRGTVSGGGTVSLTSRGSLTLDSLTGAVISLKSNEGDITVSNLTQKTLSDGTQTLNASALNGSIDLKTATDLYIDLIEANRNVTITTTGSLYDAQSRDSLDNFTAEERIQNWIDAGLLGEGGTNNGETLWQQEVDRIEAAIKSDFQSWESYKTLVGDNEDTSGLNSTQLSEYNRLKARYSAYSKADDAIAAERNNPDSDLAKTVADKANYGWYKEQLLYAISDTIINPSSDTSTAAGSPNIKASAITIYSSGSVGQELDSKTYNISDLAYTKEGSLELYQTLARADADDVKWDTEAGTFTVALKRPISVLLTQTSSAESGNTGSVFVNANKNIYLASDEKLTVSSVSSTAKDSEVRLSAGKGIETLAGNLVKGTYVLLHGGTGSVGSESLALNVDASKLSVTAGLNAYVNSKTTDLYLGSVSVRGTAVFSGAGYISSFLEENTAQGYVSAKKLVLNLEGTGSDVYLLLRGDSDVAVNAEKADSLSLVASQNSALSVKGAANFSKYVVLSSDGNLTIADGESVSAENVDLAAIGNLTLNDVSIAAGGKDNEGYGVQISVGGNLSWTGGSIKTTDGSVLIANTDSNVSAGSQLFSFRGLTAIASAADLKVSISGSLLIAQNGSESVVAAASSDRPAVEADGRIELSALGGITLADMTELKASGGDISLVSNGRISASDATVWGGSAVKVQSNGDAVDLSGAKLVTISSGDGVDLSAGTKLILNKTTIASYGAASAASAGDIEAKETDISAGGVLTVSGALVTVENASLKAFGLTLTGADGIALSGTALESSGALSLTSKKGSVSVTGGSAEAQNVDIEAKNGSVALAETGLATKSGDLLITGGSVSADRAILTSVAGMSVDSSGTLGMKGVALSSSDDISLTASGAVELGAAADSEGVVHKSSVSSAAGSVTLSGSSVGLAETDDNKVSFKAGKSLTVTASSGDIDASYAVLTASAGSVLLDAAGGITAKGTQIYAASPAPAVSEADSETEPVTVPSGSVTLKAQGDVGGQSLSVAYLSGAAVTSLSISGNKVDLTGAKVKAKTVDLNAAGRAILEETRLEELAGDLTVAADQGVNLFYAVVLGKVDTMQLTSASAGVSVTGLKPNTGDETLSVSSLTAEAAGSISLISSELNAGSVTLKSDAGGVSLYRVQLAGIDGDVSLQGKRDVDVEDVTLTGSVKDVTFTSYGSNVKAKSLRLSQGETDTAASSFEVTAEGYVTLDNSGLTDNSGLKTRSVALQSVGGEATITGVNITGVDGDVEVTSNRSLKVTNLSVDGAVTKLTLQSKDGGDVVVKGLKLNQNTDTAAESAVIGTGYKLSISDSDLKAAGTELSGIRGVEVSGSGFDGTGILSVTSTGGTVSVANSTVAAGSVSLAGADGVTVSGGSVTASGNIAVTSGNGSVVLGTAEITSDTGNIELKGDKGVSADKLTAGAAAINVLSEKGAVALGASQFTAAGALFVKSVSSSVTFTEGAALTAGTTLNVNGVTVSGQKAGLKGQSINLAGTSGVSLTGSSLLTASLEVTADTGAIDLLSNTVIGAETDEDGKVTAASDSLTLKAGTGISLESAVIGAKGVTITASDGVNMQDSTLTLVGGKVSVDAGSDLKLAGASVTGNVTSLALKAGTDITGAVTLGSSDSAVQDLDIWADGNIDLHGDNSVIYAAKGQVNSGGSANLSSVTISGLTSDLVVTARSTADFSSADISASAASEIRLESTGADVKASKLKVLGADQVTVTAANAVGLVDSNLTSKAVTVTATSGEADLSGASLLGIDGELGVTAGGTAKLGSAVITASKDSEITLESTGADVAADGLKVNEGADAVKSVTITASEAVGLAGSKLTSKTISVTATSGEADLSVASLLGIDGKLGVTAGGTVNLGSAVITASKDSEITLDSTRADVAADGLKVNEGADAVQSVSVTGKGNVALGDVILKTLSASLDSGADVKASGLKVLGADKVTVKAANAVGLVGSNLTSKAVTVTATSGEADLSGASLLGIDGKLGVKAGGTANLGSAVISASAASEISLESTGADVAAGGLKVNAENTDSVKSVTVTAADTVGLAGSKLTSKAISVTATSGSADLTSAKLKEIAGDVTVTAQGAVNLTKTELTGSAGKLSVTSEGSDVTADSLNVAGAESVSVEANGSVGLKGAELTAKKVKVTATTGSADLTSAKLKEIAGDVTVTAQNAVNLTRAELTGSAVALGVTSNGSDVTAESLKVAGAESVSVKANNNVVLKGAELTAKTLYADAGTGSADLSSATISGVDGNVTVTTQKDVSLENAFIKGTVKELKLTSSEGALKLESSSVGSDAKTAGTVLAKSITLSAKGDINVGSDVLKYKASDGSLDISGANLTLQKDSSLEAAKDVNIGVSQRVTASDSVTIAAGNAVEITSGSDAKFGQKAKISAQTGSVTLDSKGGLAAGPTFTVNAGTDANISSSQNLGLADSATVTAGKSLSVKSGSGMTLGQTTKLTATAGSVTLDSKGGLTASDSFSVTAGTNVSIGSASAASLGEGTTVTATKGTLAVTAKSLTALDNLTLTSGGALSLTTAEGDVVFAADTTALSGLSVEVTAAGNLKAVGAKVTANGDVSLVSNKAADLTNVKLNDAVAVLTLKGAESLAVSGLTTGSTRGTVEAGSIEISSGGRMNTGADVLKYTAKTGGISVEVGSLDLLANSTLTGAGDVSVVGTTHFTAGDYLSVTGKSVSVAGGEDNQFSVGKSASFTSTDGDITVLAAGDMVLGGNLSFNANRAAASESGYASVLVGAEGILSVTDDKATVSAEAGRVTVYGGRGMSVRNDLTILSGYDATIRTAGGNLSVGNGATVRAGKGLSAESMTYGLITVDAGENFTIGEKAYIHGDAIVVKAKENITFGDEATLIGATNGVQVISDAGTITMGKDLKVESAAAETLFSAVGGDIVIGTKGTLTSSGNKVVFEAGNNITFGDDFTVNATGFRLEAGQTVRVGDNSDVLTKYLSGSDAADGSFITAITAGNGVVYGRNATFDTTELVVTADGGSIVFDDGAFVRTTLNGVKMTAAGDILFGENALLATYGTNINAAIELTAKGSITMGNDADILGGGQINLTAYKDITVGDNATVFHKKAEGGANDNFGLVLSSIEGTIRFGENAKVTGNTVMLFAGDGAPGSKASVYFGNNAAVNSDDVVYVYADGNIEVGGALRMNVDADGDLSGVLMLQTTNGDVILHDDATLFANGEITLDSGRNVSVGNNAWIVSNEKNDEKLGVYAVTIGAKGYITFGRNAHMETNSTVTLAAEGAVTLNENAFIASYGGGVQSTGGASGIMMLALDDEFDSTPAAASGLIDVESAASSVTLKDGAAFYAAEAVTIQAKDNVEMSGESWIDADKLVEVTAAEGDIVMTDSIRLGGVYPDNNERTDRITLTAGGSVSQLDIGDSMGVTAQNLEVNAGGSVKLDAVESNGNESGNDVASVTVNAGGSVALAVENAVGATTLTVNEGTGGAVNGSLSVLGTNTDLVITNAVTVADSASVHAASITGTSLAAGAMLSMSTSSYDAGNTAGITFDNLSGGTVGLLTSTGGISVGTLSSDTTLTVLRKGTDANAAVTIGSAESGTHSTFFNARGDVDAAVHAEGQIYVFLGSEGTATKESMVSDVSRVAVVNNAAALANYLPDVYSPSSNQQVAGLQVFDFRSVVGSLDSAKADGITRFRSEVVNTAEDRAEDSVDYCGVNPDECVTLRWVPGIESSLSDIKIDLSMNN
jgi:hypothetical protein